MQSTLLLLLLTTLALSSPIPLYKRQDTYGNGSGGEEVSPADFLPPPPFEEITAPFSRIATVTLPRTFGFVGDGQIVTPRSVGETSVPVADAGTGGYAAEPTSAPAYEVSSTPAAAVSTTAVVTPTTSAEVPITTVEAPTTTTEAPTTINEAPTTIAEAPTTTAEAPTTTAEAPTAVVEAPTTIVEAPTTIAEVPTTTAEAPTTIAEAPTTIAEAPTTAVEAPTTVVEAPTTIAEAPYTTTAAATAPTATAATYAASASSNNKESALGYNMLYATLTTASSCDPNDPTLLNVCIDGAFAQCEAGKYVVHKQCGKPLGCYALPLENGEGFSVACTSADDAAFRMGVGSGKELESMLGGGSGSAPAPTATHSVMPSTSAAAPTSMAPTSMAPVPTTTKAPVTSSTPPAPVPTSTTAPPNNQAPVVTAIPIGERYITSAGVVVTSTIYE